LSTSADTTTQGGGSTFGVLISATLKVHPNYKVANFTIEYTTTTTNETDTNPNESFHAVLAELFTQLVDWSDRYINGYFTFGYNTAVGAYPQSATDADSNRPSVSFVGYGHNQTAVQLRRTISPFLNTLNATAGIESQVEISEVPRMTGLLGKSAAYAPAGVNIIIGSRLWNKEVLLDKPKLLDFFDQVDQDTATVYEKGVTPGTTTGLLISGPGLRDAADADGTSVTPAWRRTYLHLSK
jgi:FAD/FMN-containing dehydrogenase